MSGVVVIRSFLLLLPALSIARSATITHTDTSASATASSSSPSQKPHLIFILQDDLGHHDIGFHNEEMLPVSSSISNLAAGGLILTNQLVHYHCSPTRRSFISGRLPIHHGEELSSVASDEVDLRWSLISDKLKSQGYATHWVGKGHTGYKSMNHLPTRRSFDSFTGFLAGSQSYVSSDRWRQEAPYSNTTYSSILYGERAVEIVRAHDPTTPLFLYLPWQAVHSPYDPVPGWNDSTTRFPPYPGTYAGMIYEADMYVGRLVAELHRKGMWGNSLIVYCSDNGGVSENGLAGINYPLRGEKHSNWNGGFRVAAFVTGGLLPTQFRGTTSNLRVHIVDWYATFCALAGADSHDDPPVPPAPVDPSDPQKDIYGNVSYPGVDGVNVWTYLTDPHRTDDFIAHPTLAVTSQVLLSGPYKLLLGQGSVKDSGPKTKGKDGWRYPNGSWVTAADVGWTCGLAWGPDAVYDPCLFHESDVREQQNLAPQNKARVQSMWAELNRTLLTKFSSRSPAELLGHCDQACAHKHWHALGNTGGGPICGVPGCRNAQGERGEELLVMENEEMELKLELESAA